MFFDIEGDPVYPEGLEYLFGVYFIEDGTPQFKDFWAHDHPSDKTAFQEVMDFMVGRLERYPTASIYPYAHYEETALKRLASRYGTREAELDDLLRNRKLVDLYKVVREALRISEPSYSLKNIESFYMEKREGEVSTAGESTVVYEHWRQTGDENLLEDIRSYNEDECRSTHLLREWLLSIRPGDIPWFSPTSEALDEGKKERQQEAERIRSEYEARLLEIGSGVGSKIGELTAYLLEFHRREAKPAWWALFDRRDKSETDLIDDPECLGGLRIKNDLPPFPVKRTTVRLKVP